MSLLRVIKLGTDVGNFIVFTTEIVNQTTSARKTKLPLRPMCYVPPSPGGGLHSTSPQAWVCSPPRSAPAHHRRLAPRSRGGAASTQGCMLPCPHPAKEPPPHHPWGPDGPNLAHASTSRPVTEGRRMPRTEWIYRDLKPVTGTTTRLPGLPQADHLALSDTRVAGKV